MVLAVLFWSPSHLRRFFFLFFFFFRCFRLAAIAGLHSWRRKREGSGCVMSQSDLKGGVANGTYTHESSELRDEFVLRHADETVRRRDWSQLT